MSQSINKIHTKQLLSLSNEDDVYQYTNEDGIGKWVKINNKIYKFYNTKYNDVINNLNDYNDNDILIFHSKNSNIINSSEDLIGKGQPLPSDPSTPIDFWKFKNVELNELDFIINPYIRENVYALYPTNNIDHYISQNFIHNVGKKCIFSCFIHPSSNNGKIALSLNTLSYNVGAYAEFNLSKLDDYSSKTDNPIIKILDSSYKEIQDANDIIPNDSVDAWCMSYSINDELYYRIYISADINTTSSCSCKLNILNANGDYTYSVSNTSDKFSVYASGFQLERTNDYTTPSLYIPTYLNEKALIKPVEKIYSVFDNGTTKTLLDKSDTNIYYLDTVVENNDNELESYTPHIYTEIKYGDIAVVNPILSFANDDIEKNKMIVNERNKNSNPNDDISQLKIKEMCNDYVVKLGSLETSKNIQTDDDLKFGIFYDKNTKEYKFISENGLSTLRYNSSKKTNKAIINALINNQGYFETWCEKGKCSYKHGFNTGGGFNFWKANKLR